VYWLRSYRHYRPRTAPAALAVRRMPAGTVGLDTWCYTVVGAMPGGGNDGNGGLTDGETQMAGKAFHEWLDDETR
jgi:hypothetical protein